MSDDREQLPPAAEAPPAANADAPPAANADAPPAATPTAATPSATVVVPVTKASGIRPPSKIGRLCSSSTPKPAVPVSPRGDSGSGDSTRKYSEDLGRKQLSDLVEADEELETFTSLRGFRSSSIDRKASTSSTYSVTSLDGLWERHPRRLSEAGLRRSSEHSVVLTEDTDSFIIGERVWVGGSKPGQIAYIGETQFAPGDWAGIVLDEPIGKNDGSVAGVRYFQCAARRGVFSRLTRLTRYPLTPPTPSSPPTTLPPTPTTPGSVTSSMRRATSPARSQRSVASSRMNASISTALGSTMDKGELRLGERVIVSSSQGSKAGTLRYWGTVDFANGVWAGVELDDPIGKNDGSVEGKRYFECGPYFGLFAPASKVSRSPSRRRPGACAIHSPAVPRRSSSRESLSSQGTSLATSLASSRIPASHARLSAQRGPRVSSTPMSAKNTLQELLREKQQHLEQLIKERELERAEVAKVTLQADRAETALTIARKECAKFASDNQKLKNDLDEISRQLEDEKQKVEDLLFRAEEDNISKEDYIKYKEKMEHELALAMQKISEAEAAKALVMAAESAIREKVQRIQLDADNQQQQQGAELQAAQALSSELQKLLDEAYALLREKENDKDEISKSLNEELNKVKLESEKQVTESKSKLAVIKTEFEGQIAVLLVKLQAAETKLTAQTQGLERAKEDSSTALSELMVKLEQAQASLDDKTQELNKVVATSKEQEVLLKKEINKAKMDLSSKLLDIDTLSENIKTLETNLKTVQEESHNLKEQQVRKISELEGLVTEMSQNNEKALISNKELQHGLQVKQSEIDKLKHDTLIGKELNEKIEEDFKKLLKDKNEEVNVLQQKLNEMKNSFDSTNETLNNEHKKLMDNKDTEISNLTQQIIELKLSANQSKQEFSNMTANVNTNLSEIKKLTEENEQLRQRVNELNGVNNSFTSKISDMELEMGDLKRNIQNYIDKNEELLKSKERLENDIENKTTDENQQLTQTINELRSSEKELADLKDQVREKINHYERTHQELNQQIHKIQADNLKVVKELTDNLKESNSIVENEKQKVTVLHNDLRISREDYEKTIANVKEQFEKDKTNIIVELDKYKEIEKNLNERLQSIEISSKKIITDLNSSLDELKANGQTSEIKLKEKLDQLVEAQNDLNKKLELARINEQTLLSSLDEMTTKFNEEKLHLESKLKESEFTVSSLNEQITNINSQLEISKTSLCEKDVIVKELTLKYSMLEVDIKANSDVIIEKDKQIDAINADFKKNLEDKHTLEKKLNFTETEVNELKQRLDLVTTDKAGNDSLLQDQQNQYDKIQRQFEELTREKLEMETLNSEQKQQLEKLQQVELLNIDKIKDLELKNNDISAKYKQYEELVKVLQMDSDKLKKVLIAEEGLKNDNAKLLADAHETHVLISNLNKELETLRHSSISTQKEISEKHSKLDLEYASLKEKYSKEVDVLQKTVREQEKLLKESQNYSEALKTAQDKVEELQKLVTKSDEDIKQLTTISEGQKKNYEDISAQLRADYDKIKKDSKKERHALKAQLEETINVSNTTKTQLESEVKKRAELQKKLDDSETVTRELQDKVELLTVHQEKNTNEQQSMLEQLTIELQNSRKKLEDQKKSDDNELILLRQELGINKAEYDKQKDLVYTLQKDLKNYKVKTELAEREKFLLQNELTKLQNPTKKPEKTPLINNGAANPDDKEGQKLLEEKQLVEGQVDFLNSVIVDMQRKNEQLMARVHALESGFTSQEADELNFNGMKTRVAAPRLFCDICDMWDAHDTEDCPRQAADFGDRPSTPLPRDPANRRPPPAPRPYCEVCEVFGHATEDCNEEETY